MLDETLIQVKRFIPKRLFDALQPAYHLSLSYLAALWYRFPSKHIKVIAVTGTKGKSSTVEILNAILETAGHKTAVSDTIRFKVGDESRRNLYKMSMPGRFSMQRLISRAVKAGCSHFICEMTSQGALLFRHRFIEIDSLIFTNLSPEHIEAHGSYENYVQAKLDIARALAESPKQRTLIANADEKEAARFLEHEADRKISYSLKDAEPYRIKDRGIDLTFKGASMRSGLSGTFNLYNILAAAVAADSEGVPIESISKAIEAFDRVPGRVEKIDEGQAFEAIVDYAHTPDSLEKLYKVFAYKRIIGVLGGTGGGRDNWKRKEMGRLADKYCSVVFLTDEDPYDEDPRKIVDDVAEGVTGKRPIIIMDRREAIRAALIEARPGDVVLITGKGTDPYIMGPRGSKQPWSDADVAREELRKIKK